ncbi:aspartate/glutamate racemase family protein [Alteromonas sp. 5E99-2]|uniref:aspartate/glutamate racemase family protein n=1 Tax=Alteromonas sp. 5E99-2 TaxID=2817683 RepID=UPI001A99AF70|nr:aspartate/glutamate racemase family protein [Alteromonas sp. 5E99-2]MBO1256598.1 aspartate/glutamate racemase family protein [Alteromonas sp. 5E99-2]
MKTIGLLGGMSWESTASYYHLLNEGIKQELGGLHSAKVILHSVDFQEIADYQQQNKWYEATELLANAAKGIESAGADVVLICTNTMHKVADGIQSQIGIPLLHIADATAQKLQADGIKRVGLLGTKFTMEEDFYKGYISGNYGIDVITPNQKERDVVHDIIYSELCCGQIKASSRAQYVEIVERMQKEGAEGIILGCTEIALLLKQTDTPVKLYDTTSLHVQSALSFTLK